MIIFYLHPWGIVWRDPFSCFSCHLQHCASSIFVFTFGQVFDLVAVRAAACFLSLGRPHKISHAFILSGGPQMTSDHTQEDQCVVCRNGWVSFECPPHLTPLPLLFPKRTFLGGVEQIHKQVWSRTSIHALLRWQRHVCQSCLHAIGEPGRVAALVWIIGDTDWAWSARKGAAFF